MQRANARSTLCEFSLTGARYSFASGLVSTTGSKKKSSKTNVEEDEKEDDTHICASSPPSTSTIATEETMDEIVVDDSYVFRGFIAWCLWGWIPIPTGPKIKSSLFTDSKVNASYGRKTLLRQALKSANHVERRPVVPAAKKTLTIVVPDAKREEQNAHRESTGILKAALELFKADFAEKELQKRSYLEALLVRDKLAAITRKSDRLTEKFHRAKKGTTAANDMKELLEKYDDEIESLELQLQDIQKAEIKRRQSNSTPLADTEEAGVCSTIMIEDMDLVALGATTTPSSVAAARAQGSKSNLCIECNITPSTHKCRKCKEYVCDLCCSSKRNLEMVWWCARCFDEESLTNQRQIREGKYESDKSADSISFYDCD
ncbi:hypothetical protein MHU86_7151 [Fragilaria crotonensis]|nr:hypothetical protein MHU86_7151 [Fragilaria crotonensis]